MRKLTGIMLIFILICTGIISLAGAATAANTTYIVMDKNSIILNGSGATVTGNIITITSAGTYNLHGTLDNGQVRVDTQDAETVRLLLNGTTISNSTSAPIYIVNAEKTVISLADGTGNFITDGSTYTALEEGSDEPNAAIFSKDDLTINGAGALTVDANYNDGITSKDDLKITGGSITVNAVNDGIRGRDSVVVKGGTTTINAEGDGIQSNNDENPEKGYISVEDGTINIVSGADGMQAETSLAVTGGRITVTSGGGCANSINPVNNGNPWGGPAGENAIATNDTTSGKGLKAGVSLAVSGGSITIDSADDSLHSNGNLTISGGTINVASGDDGIHSESTIDITGGDISITKSYEGIESSGITIEDGTIHLVASDDGINAVSNTGSTPAAVVPGQGNFETAGNNTLAINGGYIVVNAGGDGIDINGPITMTDGVVIIYGPTDSANGALDYTGSFTMTGGTLVAAGSSGMAMAPDNSSSQYAVMMTYPQVQAAGTMVHVGTSAGTDVLTIVPAKMYQSVVFSLPGLVQNGQYVVWSGGSSTGTMADGLYSGGIYTPGTQVTTFNITGIITNVGSPAGGMQGPGPGTPNNTTPWGPMGPPGNITAIPTTPVTTTVPATTITTAVPTTIQTTAAITTMPTTTGTTSVPATKGTITVPGATIPSGQYGQVSFSTAPSGAAVVIDGVPSNAVTPVSMTLAAGSHQVTFKAAGYNELQQAFVVPAASWTSVSGNLAAGTGNQDPGSVTVTPAPTAPVRIVTVAPAVPTVQTPASGGAGPIRVPSWATDFLANFRFGWGTLPF
jgi:hypothetical protein